jgi:hypothetical protein
MVVFIVVENGGLLEASVKLLGLRGTEVVTFLLEVGLKVGAGVEV